MEINLKKLSNAIDRHHKKIIIIWLALFIISIPIAVHLFGIVSYNVTGSQNSTASGNSLQLVLTVSNTSFSNNTKAFLENISKGFSYNNITSVYSIEYQVINSSYYNIKKSAEEALSLEYLKYNFTPKTIPETLNYTIIKQVAKEINNSLNSSSIVKRSGVYDFILGAIMGYKNSTPLYIINNYNFANYPIAANPNDTLNLINYNGNTTIATVNNSNYSFVNTYIAKMSGGYGLKSYVTGSTGLSSSIESSTNLGTIIAIGIGILMVIIITGFIFKSPIAAFIPLIVYMVDVSIAFSIFYIIYHIILKTTISFLTRHLPLYSC